MPLLLIWDNAGVKVSQRSEWASVVVGLARQHDYLIFELHGHRAMGGFRLISINELSWLFSRCGWVCFVEASGDIGRQFFSFLLNSYQ